MELNNRPSVLLHPSRLIVAILVLMSRGAMPGYHIIKEKKRMRSPSSFRGSFRPPTFSVNSLLLLLKMTEKTLSNVIFSV